MIQRANEVIAIDRLLDIVVCAATQGPHGEIVLAVPGDEQCWSLWSNLTYARKQVQTVHTGHFDIGDDRVVVRRQQALERS